MKINLFLALIAFFVGVLVFFGLGSNSGQWAEATAATVAPTLFLIAAMGIRIKEAPRATVSFKILTSIWFVGLMTLNLILFLNNCLITKYILWDGLITLIGVALLYSIAKNKQ